MPSNSYKISRVIVMLQEKLAEHGDLDCVLISQGVPVAIGGDNVIPVTDLPSGKLRAPVLAFGLSLDAMGSRTNMPGQRYMVDSVDDDGWNHDLSAAPTGVEIDIWRRFKKNDRGQKDADGRWWVYNDGSSLVECAAQGVLGWRPPR